MHTYNSFADPARNWNGRDTLGQVSAGSEFAGEPQENISGVFTYFPEGRSRAPRARGCVREGGQLGVVWGWVALQRWGCVCGCVAKVTVGGCVCGWVAVGGGGWVL